jgi:hypothetical protein
MSKHPADDPSMPEGGKPAVRSPALSIELLATLGLALSTLVAITVVSIGIARAQPGLTATVLFIN